MKFILNLILLFIITIGISKGQVIYKNALEAKPFVMFNHGFADGEFLAYGLGIEYSRSITKKIDASVFIGKGDINGWNTNAFALEPDEKSTLGYTQFNFGFDYQIIGNDKLKIYVGLSYMLSQFNIVAMQIKSGDQIVYRQISQKNLTNYLAHIKMDNKLGTNTYWTTQFSYQPYFIDANEVLMLRTGIGFRF
jgi:hypothetical protein